MDLTRARAAIEFVADAHKEIKAAESEGMNDSELVRIFKNTLQKPKQNNHKAACGPVGGNSEGSMSTK